MKDIPMFTTEFGVATLILKEVPYRQIAYIIIQSAQQPEELLKECISFCRMVGAERIYARGGYECVESYPLHTVVYEMRGSISVDGDKVENLWPVTKETVGQWRQILNEHMRNIDNAGTLEARDEEKILEGGAYFVHRSGELLGIGWLDGDELLSIVSMQPGLGERVLHTLLSVTCPEQLRLDVASTNFRAVRFYEKMGMIKTSDHRRWYRVL